jgi:hypothetical protein
MLKPNIFILELTLIKQKTKYFCRRNWKTQYAVSVLDNCNTKTGI